MNSPLKYLAFSFVSAVLIVLLGCEPKSEIEIEKSGSSADVAVIKKPVSHVVADQVFNTGWKFVKSKTDKSLDDLAKEQHWENVNLPHVAVIEPKVVNDQWQGYAWYTKRIPFDPAWEGRNIFLTFEGAMNETRVWLNGKKIAHHFGGYLPFTANLTPALKAGDNILYVSANNEDNPVTGPKTLETLDFNMYGGLYRDVKLRVENSVYISDAVNANEVAGGGVFVTFPKVAEDLSQVNVKTHVVNTGEETTVVVEQSLMAGDTVVTAVKSNPSTIAAGDSQHINLQLDVKDAQLWSPKSPHLYQLVTRVEQNGAVVDEAKTSIGIREFIVKPDGFYINGEKAFLRGVNRHQEYPYVGYALSPQADYRDAVRIKSAGFDYVRLSHYPHSPAFMQAANELGLVLLDAILGWQYITTDPKFVAQVQQTCRDMIRRDRNHPSVFAWECSLNESWMENMEPFVERLNEIVHEEMPGENVYSAGWVDYGYDIYLQARQHRIQHYGPPADKPYIVSEYGDWEYYAMNAGLNQDSWGDLLQEERSSRQLLEYGEERLLQQATNIQEAHNDNFNTVAVADGYWVMFDYNRGYADDLESSGIMSIDRLPKYSYYFYQSQRPPNWQDDRFDAGPMVYIANYWEATSTTQVRVFSNAEEVELLVNGQSIAKQKPSESPIASNLKHPPFIFDVKTFTAGEITAKAFIGGKVVAEHSVATPSDIHHLSLSTDARLGGVEPAVGDTVFVYAELQNEDGMLIPRSGVEVDFSVVKGVTVLGPSTHKTEAGIASLLVRIDSLNEAPIIDAKAKGLPPGRLRME